MSEPSAKGPYVTLLTAARLQERLDRLRADLARWTALSDEYGSVHDLHAEIDSYEWLLNEPGDSTR